MFDLGWTEFIVVAVVAILVVGPKELPGMLRTIGKTIGSMRRMAGDFQRQMNDALKEADLDGIKTGIESVNSINPVSQLKNSLNPVKQAAEDVQRDINKGLLNAGEGAKPETSKPTAPDAVAAEKPKAAPKPKTAAKTAAKPKAAAKTKAAAKPAAPKTAAAASKSAAAKTSAAKTATTAKAGAAKTTAARKPAAKKTTAKTAGASKKETDA
ncbi:UNVERIFIED_CONTAM: hypothetical protein GTU68_057039 [Idotea baltica]|nr:hypothetical protein [Idotea baltica]